jgi:glycerophosphoryl diester phosphodiesterase
MKVAIFQPPYPHEGTAQAAVICINWMKSELNALVDKNIDLIILPEYANCPGIEEAGVLRKFVNNEGKGFSEILQSYAVALNCPVLAGIAEENELSELKNRVVFFSPDGEAIYKYDKIHLTQAELDWGIVPGSEVGIFEWNGLKLGFSVCFDIYFAEYNATLAAEKIDMLIYPAYQRGQDTGTLEAMTRTRAIDSGAWVLRSSYSVAPDSPQGGYSMLVDSGGKILANAKSMPGVLIEDFDPNDKYRKPASYGKPEVLARELLEDKRRPGVYRTAFEKRTKYLAAPYPRLCAHRGLSISMPENSVPAFAAAIATGAHEIEFDLWLSADGVPVVCHDPDLNRVAGVDMIVSESSWKDISKIDLGAFKGKEWSGIKIPRFEDILAIADGSFGMNIHIKNPGKDGELVKMVADMLKERCLLDCAYIGGEANVMEAAVSLAPEVTRACLVNQSNPDELVKAALKYDCGVVQFFPGFKPSHTALMAEAGIVSNLFYSDNYEEALGYVDQGIDVILTNVAQLLISKGFNNLTG